MKNTITMQKDELICIQRMLRDYGDSVTERAMRKSENIAGAYSYLKEGDLIECRLINKLNDLDEAFKKMTRIKCELDNINSILKESEEEK